MAAKKSNSDVRNQARAVATGGDTRRRVRDLTVRALRDRDLKAGEISELVHDVLHGVSEAVDDAIPASKKNVLRQVFDGMGDAVDSVAAAGSKTVRGVKATGRSLATGAMPTATKRVRAANDEFIRAVRLFAKKTSAEVGEELDALARRAKRTGGKVSESATGVMKAADGRIVDLTGEAARAGVSVARRAAGGIAMAASGLLEGLGAVMMPRRAARTATARPNRTGNKPKAKPASAAKKRTKKKATKRRS